MHVETLWELSQIEYLDLFGLSFGRRHCVLQEFLDHGLLFLLRNGANLFLLCQDGLLFFLLTELRVEVGVAVSSLFLLGWFEVDALSVFLFALLHPFHDFLHAFVPLAFILVHIEIVLMLVGPELSADDLAYLLSVLDADVLEVLAEGLLFVGLVEIDCVVDQLHQVCIQVHAGVLLFFGLVVDLLDHVVVLLVVGALFGLLLDELGGVSPALLADAALLGDHHGEFAQFFEVAELLSVLFGSHQSGALDQRGARVRQVDCVLFLFGSGSGQQGGLRMDGFLEVLGRNGSVCYFSFSQHDALLFELHLLMELLGVWLGNVLWQEGRLFLIL
jgi:hypothetical protein